MKTSRAEDRIVIGCKKVRLKKILKEFYASAQIDWEDPKEDNSTNLLQELLAKFEYRSREKFDWISPLELAFVLGVAWRTLYRWIEAGMMPATKFGPKKYFIRRKDIQRLFKISNKEIKDLREQWEDYLCELRAIKTKE